MDDIIVTDNPIYVCEVCDKFFYDRSSLELHSKTHSEHVCPKCHKKFKLKDQWLKHTRSDACKQRFDCEYCKKTFDDDSQLKCHLITHDEARNYVCGVCKKAFHYRHVLVIHSNICHHKKPKQYACDFCNKPFTNKAKLKIHIKEHDKGIESNLIGLYCDSCKKNFSDEKAFEMHSCKTAKGQYVCEICLKTFKVKSSLTRHSLKHVCNGDLQQSCKKKKITDVKTSKINSCKTDKSQVVCNGKTRQRSKKKRMESVESYEEK